MSRRLIIHRLAAAVALNLGSLLSAYASPRVEVHLFGGDMRDGAPLASWYRKIGITDVWLYPF